MKREILIATFLGMPWAMRREYLANVAQLVARWHLGKNKATEAMEDDGPPVERISAFEASRRQAQARAGAGGIAVVPIYGPIVQRAGMMTEFCGGASTQQISGALRDALADETVSSILLDVDSPGGSVFGISELADEIITARAKKPVVAIANSQAASAAYWLAACASEFYVTPGGQVGSIGVVMAHEDWSKALAEQGVTTTYIHAGDYKVEGNHTQPLSEEARTYFQSQIDHYYAAFTKAVARGRGVGIDSVRKDMGQGRMLVADAAVAAKMVDGIMTFDGVVKKMRADQKPLMRSARVAHAQRMAAIEEADAGL